jgi:hypothetical protein
MFQFKNISEIKDSVREARFASIQEAKRECGRGVFQSRGTYLTTADLQGGQCDPRPAAECCTWNGTYKEIEKLVNLCLAEYPKVTQIEICGGYDHAESLRDYHDDNYYPWASSWSVVVWKR